MPFFGGGGGGGDSGGGGRVTSWKTVGTDDSDDYATVSAALDDGEYSLILTSSVTESVGLASLPDVDVSITVESPGFTWTFADGIQIVSPSYSSFFNVFLNGATIAWGNTSSGVSPFDFTGNNAVFNLNGGGNLINTSTAATTPIAEQGCIQGFYGNYRITAANVSQGGISCASRSFYADVLKITGGGTSCYYALNVSAPSKCKIGTLEFTGSWSTSTSLPCYGLSYNSIVDYLFINMSSGTPIVEIYGEVGIYKQQGSNELNFKSGATVRQGYQSAGQVNINNAYNDNISYKSVTVQGRLDWLISPGKYIFKTTSTTDATKTQLFIDASSLQFELNSNDVLHGSLRVTCVRDNQDYATFFIPIFTAKNDGGTTTVSAPGTLASLTPDDSSGTGSTLTLDVEADDTNDAPAFYITCNASENWDTTTVLTFSILNN